MYISIACVLLMGTTYVDLSEYEYADRCADDNGYISRYLCVYELENEK